MLEDVEAIKGCVGKFVPAHSEMTELEIRRDYAVLLEDALDAFEHDPSYLIDMAEHASLIAYKRSLWEVRMEVQRQEAYSKSRCTFENKNKPFTCFAEGACGFGDCRFSVGTKEKKDGTLEHYDYSEFEFSAPGTKERPVGVKAQGPYGLDSTIDRLLIERGVRTPAKLSRGSRRAKREAA